MVSKGKCHCGQTEWTVEYTEIAHTLCHCDTCKALCGGTCTLNQAVPKENLKITKGDVKIYTYNGDSGLPVHCYYCPSCTTHVYHHAIVAGDMIAVRTILLDNGKEFLPVGETYGKARLPWEKEVATTYETFPPA